MRFFYRGLPYPSDSSDDAEQSSVENSDQGCKTGLSDVQVPSAFITLRYRGVPYLRARYGSRDQ